MSLADELRGLAELREQGILTPEEFETQKALLLDASRPQGPAPLPPGQDSLRRRQTPEGLWECQAEDGNWYLDNPPVAPPALLAIEGRTGQLVQVLIGIAAGIVGFIGFFLDFFSGGRTSLSSTGSGWFDLVPIFIGLATIALLLPFFRIFSALSLISLGIAFGVRGFASGIQEPRAGYGVGFWMITVGAGVLALIGLALQADFLDVETGWAIGVDRSMSDAEQDG